MKELVDRFQRNRWGVVRKIIEQIPPTGYAVFRKVRYNSAKTTVARMNYIYEDRHYSGRITGDYYKVTRTV